jgi:hypothetical protein
MQGAQRRGTVPKVPGPARLRVVGGGLDEAVLRRRQLEDAHPEIVITAPGLETCLWTAHRGGTRLAGSYQLSSLLDTLALLLANEPARQ